MTNVTFEAIATRQNTITYTLNTQLREWVHLMRGLQSNTKGDRECAVRTPPLPTSIVMDVCGVWLATIFFILLTKSVRVRACFRNRWTSHRCQAIHFEAHKGDISRSLQCKSDADGKIHLENSKFLFFDRKMKGNSTSVDVTVSAFTFNIHSARQLLLIHSIRFWDFENPVATITTHIHFSMFDQKRQNRFILNLRK